MRSEFKQTCSSLARCIRDAEAVGAPGSVACASEAQLVAEFGEARAIQAQSSQRVAARITTSIALLDLIAHHANYFCQ